MMIQSPKQYSIFYISVIYLSLILFIPDMYCQDLTDETHTQQFATHLFKTKQFNLAVQEYERLIFFDSANIDYQVHLIKSYRLSGEINQGISRIKSIYPSLTEISYPLSEEYIKLYLLNGSNNKNTTIFDSLQLPLEKAKYYTLCQYILNEEWEKAGLYYKSEMGNMKNIIFESLMLQKQTQKHKKPYIGGLCSTIVPGTGKAYAGQWKDGLISLLIISGNAWAAYRGFSEQGSQSAYGWIFGSLSVGFYFGNIYGSVKAVKNYNAHQNSELNKKAKAHIFRQF